MTWHPTLNGDEGGTRKIGDAIDRYLSRGGHSDISLLSRVLGIWETTVGAHVATHVRPISIADDILVVEVDQPAWSTEISFVSTRILSALEAQLEEHVASYVKPKVRGGSSVE